MYHCSICNENKYKEPIFRYNINKTVQNICSFGCWCRRNKNIYTWNNTINKEDFLQYPIPFVQKETKFQLLSNSQLDQMTNVEVSDYLDKLDNYLLLNPTRKESELNELNDESIHWNECSSDDYLDSEDDPCEDL